jgi:hypothetical protein
VKLEDRNGEVTSLAQMASMISNGSMPPTRALVPGVHFHLSDSDRSDLLKYLNQVRHRETCPMLQGFALRKTKGRGASALASDDYLTAADRCGTKMGAWIPGADQLIEFLKQEEASGTLYRGCFWTATLNGHRSEYRTVVIVEVAEGKAVYIKKNRAPSSPCQTLCASDPTL